MNANENDVDDDEENAYEFGPESEEELDFNNIEGDISLCQDDGQTYKVGQFWQKPGVCEIRTCSRGGITAVAKCPRLIYDKKKVESGECVLKNANENREYPHCCEMVYCNVTEEDRETIRDFNNEK